MLHIVLHFLVPSLVARGFYRGKWRVAFLIMIATMAIDADHLLADPIYDPGRCSIGFHPGHSVPAIALYLALFLLPFLRRRLVDAGKSWSTGSVVQCVGLGLIIHMLLDGIDCLTMP